MLHELLASSAIVARSQPTTPTGAQTLLASSGALGQAAHHSGQPRGYDLLAFNVRIFVTAACETPERACRSSWSLSCRLALRTFRRWLGATARGGATRPWSS